MNKQNILLSTIGLLIALLAVSALFGLFAHGYDISSAPGVFIVQGVLVAIIAGVYIAWQHGALLLRAVRAEYLKRSFPNQPWLWRLDWSCRTSMARKSTKNITAWIAAIWNLGVTPIAVTGVYTTTPADASFPLSALSIVIGTALFAYALYRMWYRAHRDNPPLRLHTNPGRPGKPFECTLGVSGFNANTKWTSELLCIYTRTESIKVQSRYITRTIIEEVSKNSFTPMVARSPRGTALALRFPIPKDAPATGVYLKGQCHWVVRVEGLTKDGFVSFSREYDVPMHRSVLESTQAQATTTAAIPSSTSGLRLIDKPLDNHRDWQTVAARDSAQPTAVCKPVTTSAKSIPAMINALKTSGILFTAGGVIYPSELWNQAPWTRLYDAITRVCIGVVIAAAALTAVAAALAPWYCMIPFVLLAMGAMASFAAVFYLRHHRYSVTFGKHGVTRRSQLLTRRWQTTIPWSDVHSVVWKATVASGSDATTATLRQLVINPDDRSTRLVLSPAIGCRNAVDALVHLFDAISRNRK